MSMTLRLSAAALWHVASIDFSTVRTAASRVLLERALARLINRLLSKFACSLREGVFEQFLNPLAALARCLARAIGHRTPENKSYNIPAKRWRQDASPDVETQLHGHARPRSAHKWSPSFLSETSRRARHAGRASKQDRR